jgi:hypothetical protein
MLHFLPMNNTKLAMRHRAALAVIRTVFALAPLLLAAACGAGYAPQNAAMKTASGGGLQYAQAAMEAAFDAPAAGAGAGDGADYAAGAGGAERKLVKKANLRIRTEEIAAAEKSLLALMETYRAWSASTTAYENSRSYTLRMPASSYEVFLAGLAGLGRLQSKTETAEDVTLQYYDLEGRLATKQELLKTFQGYLSRANDIDEIMTVERRIAELQQEIDWTGTQLRNLAHLVDYSTIELELLGPAAAVVYGGPSLGERFGELFGGFGDVVSACLVVVTGIVIYGVPAALLAVLLFWLLFGRVGLIKRLWRLAAGTKTGGGL